MASTNDATVISSVDVVASLLTIAGVAPAADVQLDGEDLSAALLGAEQPQRTTPLYWVRPLDRPGQQRKNLPDLAIRSGNWKLLTEYDGSEPQLYDLAADHPERVDALRRDLLEWHRTAAP